MPTHDPFWHEVLDQVVPVVTTDDEVPTLSLSFGLSQISEFGGSTTGTVTRNTELLPELVVTLTSGDESEATVPATVTIPAGETSASFPIAAVDDDFLDGTQSVAIGASVVGFVSAEAPLEVTDYEPLSIEIRPTWFTEAHGPHAALLEISRHNTELDTAILVTLHSGDTSECTVPETVEIPAGHSSVEVWIAAEDDWGADGPQTVEITASAAGFLPAAEIVSVTDWESHQSPTHPCDVNRDWEITPEDVLVVVNAINLHQVQALPVPPVAPFFPPPFLDANGDGELTAEDALAVISDINENGSRAVPRPELGSAASLPLLLPAAEGEPVWPVTLGQLPPATAEAMRRAVTQARRDALRGPDRVFESRWQVSLPDRKPLIDESLELLVAGDILEDDLLGGLWADLEWLLES